MKKTVIKRLVDPIPEDNTPDLMFVREDRSFWMKLAYTYEKKLKIAMKALEHIEKDYLDNEPDPTNSRHWFRSIAKNAREQIERIY